MDFLLTPDLNGKLQMSFDAVFDCRNNMYLSLHIKKGSQFFDKNYGSRLHEIKSNLDSSLRLAETFIVEALQWMVKIGKLKSFEVTAQAITDGIELDIQAVSSYGNIVPYIYYHRIK